LGINKTLSRQNPRWLLGLELDKSTQELLTEALDALLDKKI